MMQETPIFQASPRNRSWRSSRSTHQPPVVGVADAMEQPHRHPPAVRVPVKPGVQGLEDAEDHHTPHATTKLAESRASGSSGRAGSGIRPRAPKVAPRLIWTAT